MYNYIYEYQFPPGLSDDPDMVFLMERYWKGLCRYCIVLTVFYCTILFCTVLYCTVHLCRVPPRRIRQGLFFCFTEPLSFTQATLLAPLTLLTFLNLPTLAYVPFTSVRQVTSC